MEKPFRFVIVGGGIAGIELASGLGQRFGRSGRASVTLVDEALAHVWKPMLHGFAAGTARSDRDRVSFLAQGARRHFRFWPGRLDAVDRASRRVSLAPLDDPDGAPILPARALGYDALVMCIGSRANDFGTPGVAEHCIFLDTAREADAFNARLRASMLRTAARGETLDVAIVGGGATGVELAAELHRAVDAVASLDAKLVDPALRVTLLESGERILPAFPPHVSEAATRTLTRIGVTVRTGAKVVSAAENGFTLAGGERIEAAIPVWAAGVRAPAATGALADLERDTSGRLVIGPTLQTTRDPAILALGDCARAATDPAPATAQAARQQARHLLAHARALMNGSPLPPFVYRDRGAIVTLGDYNGWGTLGRTITFGGGLFRGLSARMAHGLLYRQHQADLLGAGRMAAAWGADLLDRLVKPSVRLD